MRLRLLPALPLFLLTTPCFAQWTWLYPKPQGNSLYDVEFLDASTAIAVGDASTVLVTHDGGATWSVSTLTAGVTATLRGVAAIDASTAVAVGDNNAVIKTEDAGATWQLLPVGGSGNLANVDFLGQIGLAVRDGTILRSTNGGANWTQVLVGYDVNAVDVVSSSVAVAVGEYLFLRSDDGGVTWAMTFLFTGGTSISFLDPLKGAFASRGTCSLTTDGGLNWSEAFLPIESETFPYITDVVFAAPGKIAITSFASSCDVMTGLCSSHGLMFQSQNGGANWTMEWSSWPLQGVTSNGTGSLLLVGQGGVMRRWNPPLDSEAIGGPTDAPLSDGTCAFANPDAGIAVSSWFDTGVEYSAVLHTTDGGDTWDRTYFMHGILNDVAFSGAGATTAYAVGVRIDSHTLTHAAVVVKSLDGGATWSDVWLSATITGLRAIDFSGPTHAAAVGENNGIVVIDNDAVSLSIVPGSGALRDVAFASPMVAVAVGAGGSPGTPAGTMARTVNGGASWTSFNPGVADWLYGVDFATDQIGVAVGARGTMARTTNAGQTWGTLSSPTTRDLYAVKFTSETRGYAAGVLGTVLETTDGGASWYGVDSPTTRALLSIAPLGLDHFVVAGPGQVVLRYQLTPVPTLITNFDAAAESFAAALRWSVRDEADLARFTIQRRDGEGEGQRTIAGDLCSCARYYLDETVTPGASYEYQLVAIDHDGTTIPSAPVRVTIPAASVELLPNHPNPFNPSTTISFVLPARAHARLAVYDIAGRHVVTLVDETRGAGRHSVEWNGVDAHGVRAASGVYMSRLDVGTVHATRKMVLLK